MPATPIDNARGILLILLAIACFASMDALAKFLLQSHEMPQVVWARYSFHLLAMALILGPHRLPRLLVTQRPLAQILRASLLLASTAMFFTAISYIPLADASAIGFLSPLLVTALSVPVLGEKVGPRRWAAVIVGLVGVLIILRPGMGSVHWASFLVLGVALTFAGFSLMTRILGRTEDGTTMLLYTAVVGCIVTSLIVPFYWSAVPLESWLLFGVVGALGGFGHLVLIRAYKLAEASALAPFSYSQLVWAMLLGFLMFGDVPALHMLAGSALLVASGLYVWHRERQLARRDRVSAG
ncbi:DMT family transporter [Oceanibaculum nanhaiense]|uniref:DMT family transporter n=1 Tax=Oceanibaculum nanhaiense TaxID=1909734 RepID=UPI003D2AC1F3